MLSIKPFFRITDTKEFIKIFRTNNVTHFATQVKNEDGSKEEKVDDQAFLDEDNRTPEVEEAIENIENFKLKVESMRDVSRLTRKTPRFKNFSMPSSLKTLRPINTKTAWSKVEKKIEEEKEYDLTLQQKINMFKEKKQKEIDEYKKMEKDVEDALSKQPKQIEAYYQRLIKKEESDAKKIEKQEQILNMARDHFGYDVDMRETRVRDLIKQLEEDRKKGEKLKKKDQSKKYVKGELSEGQAETESQSDAKNQENSESKAPKNKTKK